MAGSQDCDPNRKIGDESTFFEEVAIGVGLFIAAGYAFLYGCKLYDNYRYEQLERTGKTLVQEPNLESKLKE